MNKQLNKQLNKLLRLMIDDDIKSFEKHYHSFAANTWTDALKETLIIQATDLDRAQHLTLVLSDITSFKMDYPIKIAAIENSIKCLSLLLPFVNTASWALDEAVLSPVQHGHHQCLKILLDKIVDKPKNTDRLLCAAALRGHTQCVELLIPISDPLALKSSALRSASECNNLSCVTLLLPVSDPLAEHSQALQWAALHQNQDMFDVLYPVSDPQAALKDLIDNGAPPEDMALLVTRIKIEEERDEIQHSVGDGVASVKKKI